VTSRAANRLLGLYTAAVLLFLFAPLAVVFANAFNADSDLVEWGGFTTRWFTSVIEDPRIRQDFATSVEVAALSVALSLVIAVTAALWWRRAGSRGRRALDATTYMRIILPEVVTALGLLVLFRRLDVALGLWTIVLGHVVFLSAYATILLQARLSTLDASLEDAAGDLGASPLRVFRRVTLPLLMPAVAVAGLLCFAFSFDDVITSAFLGGGQTETLPSYILGSARLRTTPTINAIGAAVTAVTALAFVAALLVARRRGGLRALGLDTRRGSA
jgi:ABC-type spermidine/putrescine transport system permease subunit II